jgi:hypothetical protein
MSQAQGPTIDRDPGGVLGAGGSGAHLTPKHHPQLVKAHRSLQRIFVMRVG